MVRSKVFNKKLYQNREWLYKKYWGEMLSTHQIAKLCGACSATIYKYLIDFNIPTRSKIEGMILAKSNHIKLSNEAIEWIEGELLGDGCIVSNSSFSARFVYSSKYKEYIKYVSNTLNFFGIKQTGKIIKRVHKKLGNVTYNYSSLNYRELLPIRRKWYPNDKKRIPKDLKLTSLVLRQHFIGDGSLEHRKRESPSIILNTMGFKISDVIYLVNSLIKVGIKATRRKRNIIHISSYSTKAFLDYIGRCPVKCYQYKWAY